MNELAALREFEADDTPSAKQVSRAALRKSNRHRVTDPSWSELDPETKAHLILQAKNWGMTPRALYAQIFKAGLEVMRDEYAGFIA